VFRALRLVSKVSFSLRGRGTGRADHGACQECGVELAGDSPELLLMLTCDDEPIIYCGVCWTRQFGEGEEAPTG
jgi:hypothetical protein